MSTAGRFRGWVAATLAVVAMTAAGAFAQTGGVLTVGKEVPADYTTIQAAVNAARPGQVIQILDTEVYEGQVTIDGRETSPWPGVTGGKNGITIRYTPPAGTAQNSNFARPTIRFRDTQNTSPRSVSEAKIVGELPGTSGNYETNGALRIIRAGGVTIDGIAVDGDSAYPFGAYSVWCPSSGSASCSNLFHGSAAITLVVANDAVIRNCDIKNAYFGMYVKDRNLGGVFGNPNPDDFDVTIPLSAFGKAGSHLIEYNRVHNNSVGLFFESAWDLGSTVRYNLIYNNFHTPATSAAITIDENNQNAGAFLFKDMYLTPIAIYNNTFYNNAGNLQGQWQIGGQHLIFNNIFSKSNPSDNPSPYMTIDNMFPNRMHNSVFSANSETSPVRFMCLSGFNCAANAEVAPGGCFVDSATIVGFNTITGTSTHMANCNSPSASENVDVVKPGALITRPSGGTTLPTIPTSANIRWLQTDGYRETGTSGGSLDTLFLSLNETSPDFLVPKWNHRDVITVIKNKGWADAGIRNADGTLADLGAIPSSGASTQATTARIKPSNIVKVKGTTATLDFSLNIQSGTFNNPKIKMLRWISPLPNNAGSWANDWTVIPAASIRTITPPSAVLTAGGNKLTVILPAALPATNMYGFFEMVIEGIDASGNTVSSDVGFLPYRQHDDYFLNIEFFPLTGAMTATTRITEVNEGDPVRMRVTALKGDAEFTGSLSDVNFTLVSNAAARMYSVSDDAPFTSVSSMAVPTATYEVYFTSVGNESVVASGAYVGVTQAWAFLGTASITVKSINVKLVYKAGENGAITGAASQTVLSGASGETVVAVPDDGYTFHHWSDGVMTASRQDLNVQGDITVIAYFADADGNVSVASGDRTIPNGNNAEMAVVAPVGSVTGEFTAGPNPVGKSSGGIAFFWQGKRIKGGTLTVYDAAGNVVKKVTIKDNAAIGNTGKRVVGSWDLKDSKGRQVSEGTYLVKGRIAASGGKGERVSVVVGVR